MLLTRNGRFNSDAFYIEESNFSQDNTYNNALLTQIKNALKTNFNIDESSLAKWEKGYKRTGKLPKAVIAKPNQKKAKTSAKKPETAPATDQQGGVQSAEPPTSTGAQPPVAAADQNQNLPAATGTPAASAQVQTDTSQAQPDANAQHNKPKTVQEELAEKGITQQVNDTDGKRLLDFINKNDINGLINWYIELLKQSKNIQ